MKINPKKFKGLDESCGIYIIRNNQTVVGTDWETTPEGWLWFNIFTGFCNPRVDDARAVRQAYASIDRKESRTRDLTGLIEVKNTVKELCRKIIETDRCVSITFGAVDPQRQRVYSRLLREKWVFGNMTFTWQYIVEDEVFALTEL